MSVTNNPHQPLERLPVEAPEHELLAAQWNHTDAPYPRDVRLEQLVAATTHRLPDRTALRTASATFTYRDLQSRADSVAAALAANGVAQGDRIGLMTERDEWLVASIFGTLAAGAGYVPLDPKWPAARLSFVLDDAKVATVVSTRGLAARHADALGATRTVLVDDLVPTDRTPPEVRGADAEAYVIYTSGSTGVPKGVSVPHRSVVNLLHSIAREPGVTEHDVVLATTTLSFDIAVSELILPLFAGATIVLAAREDASDGSRLRQLIDAHGVTLIDATPTTWRLLQAAGWPGHSRVTAICTGEAMPPDLAAWLLPRVGTLWNGYGPTETTVWSAFHRVDRVDGPIPIGRPIANTVIYVLDPEGDPVPVGSTGELWIGGDGVALGYVGRPDLTEARFRPDPFRGTPGARMYRTGDLGRWRSDGTLEYFGRIDGQIKLRGHRIELGEIEAALRAQPAVTDAVATTWEPQPGDVRLVAYVTSHDGLVSETDVRASLLRTLPEYMVPQRIVRVDQIPLTSSGKVDRSALPPPADATAAAETVERPLSAVEERIAQAFAEALAVPHVGPQDDFFGLGGHSLLAVRLALKLSRELERTVPMSALFQHPTVESLAAWLDRTAPDPTPSTDLTPRLPPDAPAPLSLMQQRVWYIEHLQPGTTVFNMPSAHRLRGALDERAFSRAFDTLIRRHDAFRTVIRVVDGEPMQQVLPAVEVSLWPAVDLSALPPDQRESELARRLDVEAGRRFDLNGAPLFHARMFRLAPDDHVFFFMPHHLIWDGVSFDIFYDELARWYAVCREGGVPEETPPALSYRDYSVWHRGWLDGPELERQVTFWRDRLAGAPTALDVPADHPRPTTQSGDGGAVAFAVSNDLADALRRIAEREGATLFMTLLSAWAGLLHAWTRQRDLVVGIATRGRHRVDVERVIGFFANTLPLRLEVDPDKPFSDLLGAVRRTAAEAFEFQDVPLEHLVRVLDVPRDHSRFPIYQAFFSYQDVRGRSTTWHDLTHEEIPVFDASAAQDVALRMVDRGDGLTGSVNYNADILEGATAELLQARYLALLEAIAADGTRPLRDLVVIPAEERARIAAWSVGPALPASQPSVAALLADAFLQHGSRTAIRFGDRAITYEALGHHAAAIAAHLRARGVAHGDVVGLRCQRSPAMVAAVAGILGVGAAYLPLDPDYPPARLDTMVEDAGVKVVLTDEDVEIAPGNASYADGPARPEDVAYLIYTSGSSGKPNGVRVPHRAVVAFLEAMRLSPGLGGDDRLVAVTTLSFDIAVLELLLPMAVGAEIVLATRDQATDGVQLRRLLDASRATVMQATPATWRLLIEAGWNGSATFKALCGGEALPVELAEALLERAGEVWNMYGPTETTVWSTCGRVEPGQGAITIGRPIAGTTVHVLDEDGRVTPIGVPGELYLGGAGVTLGYHNRPELTAARFVPDPLAPESGARLYRTGDLARWRPDGRLQHLGRIDFQVKVRGYRVETGEIESALLDHPALAEAVVVARPGPGGEGQLVAYLVPQAERNVPPASELREHVRRVLPHYMVPAAFVPLPAMPRTPNGKVNRRALPEPTRVEEVRATDHMAPLTTTEKTIAEVWCRLLGVDRVERLDNFIDLGGHSLLIMRAISALEDRTGRRVGPRSFIFQTLEQLAREYDQTPGVAEPIANTTASSSRRSLLDRVRAALTSRREA